ncbi:MAG TPA: helix-turn-helix domain-containing protein [Anaerolineaceae bacterium]
MPDRDIGQEILDGIREIKAYKAGQRHLTTRQVKEPAPPQVIRAKMKLSQAAFAGLMGVSVRTIQDWEQGRRKPSGPALALLRIAEQKPEVFLEVPAGKS